MLEHGGRLKAAARAHSIPLSQWIDLSTGINPDGWPVPVIDSTIWNRLPEEDDGLLEAAAGYYGTEQLLPVAGSQAAIQLLPQMRKPCRVAIVSPGYAEHEQAWRRAGHQVLAITANAVEENIDQLDIVVVINPNNPTGELLPTERLVDWHQKLSQKGGWLIVDEAFMDASETESLIHGVMPPGLIIFRSLGKFFGLAGVRVGFVAAEQSLLQKMAEQLGPWTIANPSREVARLALKDEKWQLKIRRELVIKSGRLKKLLTQAGLEPSGGTELFQYIITEQASAIYTQLAKNGVLVRLFQKPIALRFGLPKGDKEWEILENSLSAVSLTLFASTL